MKTPNLYPSKIKIPASVAEVMLVAEKWYDQSIVKVNSDNIKLLSRPDVENGFDPAMLDPRTPAISNERIALAIALNSINYQFWDINDSGDFIRYGKNGLIGAAAMMDSFKAGWQEGEPLDLARRGILKIDVDLIKEVFGEIPNPESRVEILSEVLSNNTLNDISEKLSNTWSAHGAQVEYAAMLAETFPKAFNDPVLKKAQLALSEIHVQEASLGLPSKCELTAFADYQIPNVLRSLGVIEYSDELAKIIDEGKPILYLSKEETAIRAAALIAVQEMSANFNLSSAAIDHFLWSERKRPKTPFHLCFTTAY